MNLSKSIKSGSLIKFNENAWASYYTARGHVNYKININSVCIVLGEQYKSGTNRLSQSVLSANCEEIDILLNNRVLTLKMTNMYRKFDVINEC